ncbi:Protein QUIRKY [Hibiscus syriacus]|uniref:Protein QUIRKY n=1 Tax=Hibiscus syriacus TaxID=106335 RepID=A0A6A2X050_HIBSY|nr:Protein QUIRKY [Hibiscus syriacus]
MADNCTRKLIVEICNAKNLMPKDGQGTASAYAIVDFDGQRRRTKTKLRDLNPVWDEKLEFLVHDIESMPSEMLEINLYNDKKAGKEALFWIGVKVLYVDEEAPPVPAETAAEKKPDTAEEKPPENPKTEEDKEEKVEEKKAEEEKPKEEAPKEEEKPNPPLEETSKPDDTTVAATPATPTTTKTTPHQLRPFFGDHNRIAFDLVDRMPFLYVRVVKAKPANKEPVCPLHAKLVIGTHSIKTKSQIDKDWDQVFAFDKERLNSSSLEVSVWAEEEQKKEEKKEGYAAAAFAAVVVENCLGTVSFDLQEVPKRVPPDSPLAPQWYSLESDKSPGNDVMVSVWIRTQADESFQSDSGGLIPETRAKVYLSPKLRYLRLTVIQTQDLQLGSVSEAKVRSPELYVKAQLGAQVFKTSRAQVGSAWNEDLVFVAAEPFELFLVVSVEGWSNGQSVGQAKIHVPRLEMRTDDKAQQKSRWFNLVGAENKPYAGRIHVRACLEGGYHVIDEAANVTSDVQAAAKQLAKPPIGLLDVGIRGACNLLLVKTRDGTRGMTDAYVVVNVELPFFTAASFTMPPTTALMAESTLLDFNHPLYLHPSDTPGTILISHQLYGPDNYTVWSRSMRIALLAKNKLGFVDGGCCRDDFQSSLQAQWDRCNALVLSWLINSVSKDLSVGIVFASSAAFVWADLKERFDKVDGSRIFFLHRDITTMAQGKLSIFAYFSRLKLLWDEYDALVPYSSCTCENAQSSSQHVSQQRLFQFLMGLNDPYTAIRSQLLFMQPLPSVNNAYSMISQEESHRLQLSALSLSWTLQHCTPMLLATIDSLLDLCNGMMRVVGKEYRGLYMLRQSRLPFPVSNSRTTTPFTLIHIDLWGPYRISTHAGQRFFLTTVDDYTRMYWVYLLRLKNDVISCLRTFILMVQNQFSVSVKIVRSDNGREFFNSECSPLFASLGIIHQSTCVCTPQQNRVAERKHRHLLEVAQALRFQSRVPFKLWGECVLAACYIINMLPSSVMSWKTPLNYCTINLRLMNILEYMKEEIHALESNRTWSFVPLPPGKVPIGCKWVYRVKYKASGEGERIVCRLQKSLYGLKQASRQWNLKLTKALVSTGYVQSKYDYSLFIKRHQGIEVKRRYTFESKEVCTPVNQDTGLEEAKPAITPLEQNLKLTTLDYDKIVQQDSEDVHNLVEKSVYQRLIGRLIYLTYTRPDITFAVNLLSQFMKQPKRSHMEAALRVVKYVKKEPGQGILLKSSSIYQLLAYCDSDWGSCPMTRKSMTCFYIKIGDSLVSWKSKKQNVVARSSAEAEYRAMAVVTSELVWLQGLLAKLSIKGLKPVKLHCDNRAALQIAANPVYHERTKHIEIDCHFVREKIQEGMIQTEHVSTHEQLADIMTKALGSQQHGYLLSKLGYTWDVYDPCTVLTIGVFDNGRYKQDELGKPGRDLHIGKICIRLSTLDTNRVYLNSYNLTVLLPNGAKKMGEIEIAVRFSCSSWLSLIQAYGTPMLPRMHYIRPLGPAQLDILRQTAMHIVTVRLSRSEPPLGQEVVQFMLDTDTHVWSMRKSKANWFRVVGCFSRAANLARWLDGIRTWANPPTTVLVHALLIAVVMCPQVVLPTVFMYVFLILALRFRYRMRIPHNVDLRLSYVNVVSSDELDEEFDGLPTTRSPDIIRFRYDRLRALASRAQILLGDVAAQGERLEALFNWKDPRATGIFVVVCLFASLVFYVVPFKVFVLGSGFYYIRHPRFRGDMPSPPLNFFRRLPSLSDQIM